MTDEDQKAALMDEGPDQGKMPAYDDPKPICLRCSSGTWVVAAGRDGKWTWYCTNCVTEFK